MSDAPPDSPARGLSLAPFRAVRPAADGAGLAALVCPPYDVIDAAERRRLVESSPDNFVAVVLPEPTPQGYAGAAETLRSRLRDGVLLVDDAPAVYVYEMVTADGTKTRGLVGAVELRDPADAVILPHENTMAGPVADRLELMTATGADLEPIYLVYDGGGEASDALGSVDGSAPLAETTTPDGVTHRVWAITEPDRLAAIERDLETRRALIADGHHRYATYRERQRLMRAEHGVGAWDRGLALLVDSTAYGPQVHPIHRVIPGLGLDDATARLEPLARVIKLPPGDPATLEDELYRPGTEDRFCAVLTDGSRSVVVIDTDRKLAGGARRDGEPAALAGLDVTVLHRGVVEQAWNLPDDVDHVGYAHSASEAVARAVETGGVAVLVRATSAADVAAVAAAGARMPRKSTLFTPKPTSGLLIRLLDG